LRITSIKEYCTNPLTEIQSDKSIYTHSLQLCVANEMNCSSNTVLVAVDIKQYISFPMHSSKYSRVFVEPKPNVQSNSFNSQWIHWLMGTADKLLLFYTYDSVYIGYVCVFPCFKEGGNGTNSKNVTETQPIKVN
jgi:hypothetical protein